MDGAAVVQTNGSNPRITPLDVEQRILYGTTAIAATDVLRCRIVQSPDIEPRLRLDGLWEISFDGGNTWLRYYPRSREESAIAGAFWVFLLTRQV